MTERKIWRGFASDNYAGVHPEIMTAIVEANGGHEVAYGDDFFTAELDVLIKREFGDQAVAFPVFNGTGANVVSLQACTKRWEAVICAATAHINTDEGGAPEKMAGLKLWALPTPDGKLTVDIVKTAMFDIGFVHRAQPAVISITNTTELGTLYTIDEIKTLAEYAHANNLFLHMDGARLSNAAAALGASFREFTTDAGVDIVSFGATKIGAMGAEAVLVLNPELRDAIPFLRKTSMQLPSKMRFISAQIKALLNDELWKRNAVHANSMAQKLDAGLRALGVKIPNRTEANAVFPIFTAAQTAELQKEFRFYVWDEFTGVVRLMCAWDTTEADVERLLTAVKAICS